MRRGIAVGLSVLLLSLPAAAEGPPRTEPLSPLWAPLLVPAQLIVPGVGHLARGETRTGLRLLATTGVVYGLTAGTAAGLIVSGAADPLVIPLVPVLLVLGSATLTLGGLDAIGTFSDPAARPPPKDLWEEDWRARVSYRYAEHRVFAQAHFLEGQLERRWDGGWVGAQLASHLRGGNLWYGLGGGWRFLSWKDDSRAGLFLEAEAGHEHHPAARYDTYRVRGALASILPLGLLFPSLRDVTSLFRIGVQPSWTRFRVGSASLRELYLVGGFETRWTVHPRVRLSGGYEHGRDGPVGGTGTGFLGLFHAGAELHLAEHLWLTGRGTLGTPLSGQLGLERRW